MGKFGCTCGHAISDVIEPNEVTGQVLSNRCYDAYFDQVSDWIEEFIVYREAGDLEPWLMKRFGEKYPRSLPISSIIHDILTGRFIELTLAMYECDECGRLWIQEEPGKNVYHGYSPDEPKKRKKALGFNKKACEGV